LNVFRAKPSNVPIHFDKVIRTLKEDTSIMIKPSDKNLGPTILDYTWYHGEMLKHLHDPQVYTPFYESLPNFIENVEKRINRIMSSWEGITTLPKPLKEFILNFPNPINPCKAYLLP